MEKVRLFQRILLYILVITVPIQTAKHFTPSFTELAGRPLDYLMPVVYIGDILIGLLFVTDILIWQKQNIFTTMYTSIKKIVRGEISSVGRIEKMSAVFFVGFLLMSLISSLFSLNFGAALVRWVRFAEMGILIFWFVKRVDKADINLLLSLMSVSLIYEVPLVFYEWYSQSSAGLTILGEWTRSPFSADVAKITFSGESYMRPYATFSHPNVLAGYLTLMILIIGHLFVAKLQNIRQMSINTINSKTRWLGVLCLGVALSASLWALLLTFSRSAWIGLILAFMVAVGVYIKHINLRIALVMVTGAFIVATILFTSVTDFKKTIADVIGERFASLQTTESFSFHERIEFIERSINLARYHPLLGVGLNNFMTSQQEELHVINLTDQPVHSIYFLLLAETGLVGLMLFGLGAIFLTIAVINKIHRAGPRFDDRSKGALYISLITLVLCIGFLDHYFLTIPPAILLLSMVLCHVYHWLYAQP